MKKRRITTILSALFGVVIVCLAEWATIKMGNLNNVEKIISGAIYIYLSIFVYSDLFHALNNGSNYLKYYHIHSFLRELALIAFVASVLMLIFGILHNERMNIPAIILLVIGGILEGIAISRAHKQTRKYWDLYKKDRYIRI